MTRNTLDTDLEKWIHNYLMREFGSLFWWRLSKKGKEMHAIEIAKIIADASREHIENGLPLFNESTTSVQRD